jgi:hypothetical protein
LYEAKVQELHDVVYAAALADVEVGGLTVTAAPFAGLELG